jgi:tetratricopeptide (TPR) repeat protein
MAPPEVTVPGERAVHHIDTNRALPAPPDHPEAEAVPRWLSLETVKANLGTARRLIDGKGAMADSFAAQAQTQLQTLRLRLEEHLHADICGAVVGVPACYGMNQRAALRSITEAAGFGNVALIDESIAVALSTYAHQTEPRQVLIYCLGRSVFATSVLLVGNGAPQALNHEGSTRLGGQDFDAMLAQQIAQELRRHKHLSILHDRQAMQTLLTRVEQAKIDLSADQSVIIEAGPSQDSTGRPGQSYRLQVLRPVLERLIAPLVAHTIALAQQAIKGAGLYLEDITEVLLVGEATRTPLVLAEVRRALGRPTRHAPPEAIACGAALHAASLHPCFVPRAGTPQRSAAPAPPPPATVVAQTPPPQAEDALLAALQTVRQTLQTGDLEAGIVAFEALLDQGREELSYLYSQRASQLHQAGQVHAAQATLERGLVHWPANPRIRQRLAAIHVEEAWRLAQLGVSSRRQEYFAHSREHLHQCLQLDPDNSRAGQLQQELARVLGRRAKPPKGKRGKR